MKNLFTALTSIFLCMQMQAQLNAEDPLYRTILQKDSLLFTIGYNQCDIRQFEQLINDDFEFYHDKSGITKGKKAFIESIRNGLCTMEYQPIRILHDDAVEIFPLYDNGVLYGAVQHGIHDFYARKETTEKFTSRARFTHIWILKNGNWLLNTGISYDHIAP